MDDDRVRSDTDASLVASDDGFGATLPVDPVAEPVAAEQVPPSDRFKVTQGDLDQPMGGGNEVSEAYPHVTSVEWPEGVVLHWGAGPLYRVLQEMGKTLEKQEAEIARPSWMHDLLEKVERAGDLNQKFTELMNITGEVVQIAKDSPEGVRLEAQLQNLRDHVDEGMELPPAIEQRFNDIGTDVTEMKKKVALTPSVTEIAQLRELVVDRCKKLKVRNGVHF